MTISFVAAFVWAYWPTFVQLTTLWHREPDYAHGFLVIPLAGWILWLRRDALPPQPVSPAWGGLLLIAASAGMRLCAASYHAAPLDAWSIAFWAGGVVWLLGGLPLLRWASPAVAFLVFMTPLPYRAERWLNEPLQALSTQVSCFFLQTLGRPAIAEGNVISLGDETLAVAESCSGLRIFVGVLAMAYLLAAATRQGWWERALMFLGAAPVALLANSARIVTTALLYERLSGETARRAAHDASGWITVPLAAVLLALLLWTSGQIYRRTEVSDVGDLLLDRRLREQPA